MKSKMKSSIKIFNNLCSPAQLYLIISVLSLLTLFYQNYNDPNKFCLGSYETKTDCDNRVFFAFKLLYIVIWLFILQKLCLNGYSMVSWLLVLLPILGMFILIGLLMIVLMKKNNQL